MSGNFAIKGGGEVGRLMANAILNFHFDYLKPSLIANICFLYICLNLDPIGVLHHVPIYFEYALTCPMVKFFFLLTLKTTNLPLQCVF